MIVRPAEEKDFQRMLEFGQDFFEFNPYKESSCLDGEHLENTFRFLAAGGILLVAETDSVVVGMIGAVIAPTYWNYNDLQGLETFLWVDPSARGSSAAKDLKKACVEQAREQGVKFWHMVALETSRPDAVGKSYTQDGYTLVEHGYMKVL